MAKAKTESIVAQTRTQADGGLVGAGDAMGKSYIPAAIDFSIDQTIDGIGDARGGRKKKGKEETEKQKQKRINKRRKQKIDDRRLGKKEGNQKIYDNLTKRKNSRGLTEQEQKALDKASKELGIKKIKENTKNTIKEIKNSGKKKREKEKIKAEQAKIEAEKQAKIDAEKLKKDKHKAKVKEIKGYQKEKDAADKEAKRLKDIQMNKKKGQVYELNSIKTEAFGGKQINQYTKEQRDRLEAEGVWSDEEEKMVLPEEIVDGEFVSQAKGTNLEVVATKPEGDNQTNNTVVEEKKTLSNLEVRKKRMADKKYNDPDTSQYIKDQMLKEGYVPDESKSPMEMRNDRVYKFARKDGPVRENMIKGGYKPQ
jgi:hypothetical protein